MMTAIHRLYGFLLRPTTWVCVVLVDVAVCLHVLSLGGVEPTQHVAVQLAFVCSWLVLLARAMDDLLLTPRSDLVGTLEPALQHVGGLLALAGLAFYMGSGVSGQVTLRPGQITEFYEAPALESGGQRFLGFALQELRWDTEKGTGSVVVKDLVKDPTRQPLRIGEPVQLGPWRALPVAQGAGTVPSGAILGWRQRGQESETEISLSVGEERRLESINGSLSLLSARANFNGQGPALKVETRVGDQGVPDRRWLFARSPDYELSGRSGEVVVRVKGIERGTHLRLSLSSRRGIKLAWLGLLMLLIGRVLALRTSPSRASLGGER